jgi:hypothetical protein
VDARRAPTAAPSASWIAEQGPGTAHLVPDSHRPGPDRPAHAAGACGRLFLPAALAAPLGPPCPLCLATADLTGRRTPHGRRPARTSPALRVGRP